MGSGEHHIGLKRRNDKIGGAAQKEGGYLYSCAEAFEHVGKLFGWIIPVTKYYVCPKGVGGKGRLQAAKINLIITITLNPKEGLDQGGVLE